jgi:broad specificity phosphatase PhoE
MSETTLLLVRHGATAANLCRPYTLQGLRPDPDLVPQGIEQARAVAFALRTFPIAKVYSSPLRRAWQTAQFIAGALPSALVAEPRLVEADTGEWTGLAWEEIEARWPIETRAFHNNPDRHGYLGGENLVQVRARVLPVIAELLAHHPTETIVVVSHGVVNRVLLAHWLDLPLRFARRLPQDNAGFNVIHFAEGKARVQTVNHAA